MKIAARSSVCAAAGPSGSTNCGINVVKTSAIFGFRRFESRPCRNGDVLRRAERFSGSVGRAAAGLAERVQAEPDEVGRTGELEHGEGRSGGVQEGSDSERGGNSPDQQSSVDPQGRLNCCPPSASEAVLEDEGHVRPRQDDDDGDDADERDQISHHTDRRAQATVVPATVGLEEASRSYDRCHWRPISRSICGYTIRCRNGLIAAMYAVPNRPFGFA